MKTKLTTVLLAIFITTAAFAQDTIFKNDGKAILVKVLEVGPASVKFRFVDASSVLTLPKNEIMAIGYQGGYRETYGTAYTTIPAAAVPAPVPAVPAPVKTREIPAKYDPEKPMLKNIIALNCFDMAFANLSVSYERILNSGKFSFKIPVSIGLDGKPNTNEYTSSLGNTMFLQNRIYSAGLEFNIYPFGQGRNTFYVGLSAEAGEFHYYRNAYATAYNYTYGYSYSAVALQEKLTGTHVSGMVHIGGYIGISENFLIGAKVAIGYKKEETVYVDYTQFRAELDLNLAYRF